MKMPIIRVTEKQGVFETHLNRLIQEGFPGAELTVCEDGEARRYELMREDTLIVEIDVLPVSNELEVQIARLRSDDMTFCETFYSWIAKTYESKARFASVVDRVTWPLPLAFTQQMFETWANEKFDHPDDEALRQKLADIARETLPPVTGSSRDPHKNAQRQMEHFKSLVERQLHKDILAAASKERFARSLLQAFLPGRGYREVEVRGGYSDLLLFVKQGRFLYETKIWRGPKYYQRGLRRLEDYIVGEDDDQRLLGIFYVVFDPTQTKRAQKHRGGAFSTESVGGREVHVVTIDLLLATSSARESPR